LILIELSNPGGWVAGFVGVVCLLLAFFGMGVLPVDWFGLIFIVVSFALFIMELNTPTHGALTVAGAVSFFIGALVLFNSVRLPGIPPISLPLVILTSVFIAGLFLAAVAFALRAQRLPVKMGDRDLVGQVGTVRGEMSPDGQVQVGGELWSAGLEHRKAVARDGERVEVVEVKGLWLKVKKTDDTP
jgi:membrane-bound serine protease (ClpP class)